MSYARTLTLNKPIGKDISLVLLASFVICLSGSISIPLWFTPVPIATQPSVVLLMAALLGARRGAAATFLFLLQGAMGLPVFSAGASMGLERLLGPTGGYLIGYLAAAFLVGTIIEKRKEKTVLNTFAALAAGNLVIYLLGAGFLATFVGVKKALFLGVAPFMLGDLFKICVSLKFLHWKK